MATKIKQRSGGFGIVRNEDLAVFGAREMQVYADKVNLDRATPDLFDGLKPVQRRTLWALHNLPFEFVKTARVVGDVIGRYHPHGDQSVSDAITTVVQSNVPTILGKGNWGSLVDPAAAMRYTNCRLSNYGKTFFGAQYINREVTSFVPNYDDTTVEPVTLPALLPNVLMTGAEGIGVGAGSSTTLPSFTPESIATVIIRLLKGEVLRAQDFADTLVSYNRNGGHVYKTKDNKKNWLKLFEEPRARVMFKAKLEVDRNNKVIELDDWPVGSDPNSFIDKIRDMKAKGKGFEHVDSITISGGATRVLIEADPGINLAQFDSLVAEVEKRTLVPRSFKINVTERKPVYSDGKVDIVTEYHTLTVPELFVKWIKARLALEVKSLEYQIKKQREAIAYSKLLIFVAQNADAIIKVIRQSMDPERDLQRKFKLSQLQAQQVLDLKLRNISKLDQSKIKQTLKEQLAHLAQLKTWLAKPKLKVIADTKEVLAAIEKDRAFEASKERKMQVA